MKPKSIKTCENEDLLLCNQIENLTKTSSENIQHPSYINNTQNNNLNSAKGQENNMIKISKIIKNEVVNKENSKNIFEGFTPLSKQNHENIGEINLLADSLKVKKNCNNNYTNTTKELIPSNNLTLKNCENTGNINNFNSRNNNNFISVKKLEKFNDSDYSTFNNSNSKSRSCEASIEINENTTAFDLYKGLIYMFLSCIFKSAFSVLSKYAFKDKKDLSSFQLLTYRTYFMMWISVSVSFALPMNVFSQKFAKLDKIVPIILRTLFAIISMSLVMYSVKFIHISDVYSVYYIYPAFVILFSILFLREKVGFFDICCLLACFCGAILIVKPDFIFKGNSEAKHNGFFFILVIFAALLKAIEDVIIRNVGKDVNFLIIPFMYSLMGIILFPIPMFLFDTIYPQFSLFDVFIIFLIGLCTFLYMAFMALGFQNESAGRVSMINYFQVALMYISDIALFDKKLHILDLLGTCLIFGFNFTNGVIKAFNRMEELNKIKSKQYTIFRNIDHNSNHIEK